MGISRSELKERITLGMLIAEFAIIVALLWGLSFEYQSNAFMRAWVAQNAWPVGYLLNGYFAAMLLGVFLGSLGVYFQRFLRGRKESAGFKT